MSLMSMTGYGAGTFVAEDQTFRVEVRSVNHRGLHVRFKAPSELAHAESEATRLIGERLGRGSIDVYVSREAEGARRREVTVDVEGARQLMDSLQALARAVEAPDPGLELVLRHGDFIQVTEHQVAPEALSEGLRQGLAQALDQLVGMRLDEGRHLAADMLARLQALRGFLASIEEAAPKVYAAYEARLQQRLADAQKATGLELDPGRLATELVAFADRSDVTEEIVRARAHLDRFQALIEGTEGEDIERGKRLDFLSQELLREFNTVGSKCRDAGMASSVVDAKVELEKVREQVQNIA